MLRSDSTDQLQSMILSRNKIYFISAQNHKLLLLGRIASKHDIINISHLQVKMIKVQRLHK